jgi:hypothetical protein
MRLKSVYFKEFLLLCLLLLMAAGIGRVSNVIAAPPTLAKMSSGKNATLSTTQQAVAPLVRDDTRVVINIPTRTLWVYYGDEIVRHYPVGLGRIGFITPMGHFKVIRKIQNPGWENPYKAIGKMRIAPGDENPLGTRWIGFYQNRLGEFGIHGTDMPQSVGRYSSHGCVRMKVSDAEVLFDLVDMGTPVDVVYEPVLIRREKQTIHIVVYADPFKKGMPTVEQVKGKILKQFPTAKLDEESLTAALMTPNEKSVEVAQIPLPPPPPPPKVYEELKPKPGTAWISKSKPRLHPQPSTVSVFENP